MPKPCLSFSVAVNTLITTKDRRLVELLPQQQANPVQAYFKATVSLFKFGIKPNFKVNSCILLTCAQLHFCYFTSMC